MSALKNIKFNYKFVLLFVVLILVPVFIKNNYIIQAAIMVLLYAYYASSWNIIGGFAGQMSIGHSAYVGIGAFVSSILFTYHGITPWIGMLVAGMFAGIFSIIIGYPTFRLKGVYYTLCTIAVVNVLRLFVLSEKKIFGYKTGAAVGFKVPWRGGSFLDMQFLEKKNYYYIILGMLMLVMIIASIIKNSKTGYYLAAITTNQDAAKSLGINVINYKLRAQFLSAFMTAMGGAFYAQLIMFLDPSSVFSYDLSVEMTVVAMVGGKSTVLGPVIGALILVPIKEFTRSTLGATFAGLPMIIYGVILMLTVFYMPSGLIVFFKRGLGMLKTKIPNNKIAKEVK